MASLKRLVRPALAATALCAFGLHSTRQKSEHMSRRNPFSSPSEKSNTPPKFAFDLSFLSSQIRTGVPSMLFTMVKDEELTLTMPGLKKVETEEGLWVSFAVQHTLEKKKWVMGFEGFNLLFQIGTPERMYLATMKFPENFDPHGDVKVMLKDDVCSICLPTLKIPDPILVKANINQEITRPTPYCEMFDRSELGRRLCEVIAHPGVKSKSFMAYKKDDGESIYFTGNMPGLEKKVVTTEGLCVSLSMPGFELEDVVAGFEYDDTLIVEGKREGEHYIAGVRVPKGFSRENGMMKAEMRDGVFKVTLPHVDR